MTALEKLELKNVDMPCVVRGFRWGDIGRLEKSTKVRRGFKRYKGNLPKKSWNETTQEFWQSEKILWKIALIKPFLTEL